MSGIRILGLNGSPVRGGNTETLIREILKGAEARGASSKYIPLNELRITPCQSCGESPEPETCFVHDDMDPLYPALREYDGFVLGSPIYFDTVSAQMKLFIDRCNCLRPMTPAKDHGSGFYFKQIISRKRPGVIVLVGGERQKIESAREVIAGFFIWANIESVGQIHYVSKSWRKGGVAREGKILEEAFQLGKILADRGSPLRGQIQAAEI